MQDKKPNELEIYSITAQTARNDPRLSSLVVELGEKHSPEDLNTFLLPAVRLLYQMHLGASK